MSSIPINQVAILDGLVSPDAPLSDSPAINTVTRGQVVAPTPDLLSITLYDIRAAQAEDDNLLPVIQALLDQKQAAHADLRLRYTHLAS